MYGRNEVQIIDADALIYMKISNQSFDVLLVWQTLRLRWKIFTNY